MSSITSASPRTLGDTLPGGLVRDIALVAGGAWFVGLAAQVAIPLPFTPVPLTLQTFSVLLTVAALGSKRGLLSMGVYVLAGMAGMPWFSEGQTGWAFASFGYVLGFVLAGAIVGKLAERGGDRTLPRAVGLMVVGNLAIYAVGVPWLMMQTGMDLSTALAKGVVPFLLGDVLKILLAAGLLPATWKFVHTRR
ncbi:MAG TPA: biotin transporter BioY [Propionibacteriaceae bacterium]|nr:biotin transporter BioY [Propionibacteriaceae bacterium]